MKSANKTRGERALPDEFGKGVFIRFTIDAMERLETEYGDEWVDAIIEGTAKSKVSIFKKVLANTLVGDADAFDYSPLAGALSETRVTILDSLFLSIHGRTVEEQVAKEEADKIADIAKSLEKMGKDPQLAPTIAFFQSFGALQQEQVSAPVSPDTSPLEK